jgi:hypothetical protein
LNPDKAIARNGKPLDGLVTMDVKKLSTAASQNQVKGQIAGKMPAVERLCRAHPNREIGPIGALGPRVMPHDKIWYCRVE